MVKGRHERQRPRRLRRAGRVAHGVHDRRRHRHHDRQHDRDQHEDEKRAERHPPAATHQAHTAHECLSGAVRAEEPRGVGDSQHRYRVDRQAEQRERQRHTCHRSERDADQRKEDPHHDSDHDCEPEHDERDRRQRPQCRAHVVPVHTTVGDASAIRADVAEGDAVAHEREHEIGEVRHQQRRPEPLDDPVGVERERVLGREHLGGARERLHRDEQHERRPGDRELPDGERPGVVDQEAQARADDVAERAGTHEARRAAVRERVRIGHEAWATARPVRHGSQTV